MNKFEIDVRSDRRSNHSPVAGYYGHYTEPFNVSYTPIKAGVFNIYLFDVIESANQFIWAIEALQAAGENDLVIIHLSTDGGSLDATDTFLTAMRDCPARIVVNASGGVHSAGTVILLEADEFTLSQNCCFLIHNGGCGSGGKYSDFKSHAAHNIRYMENVMRTTYADFLTEEEITSLLAGVDFWLNAEEFSARWTKRNEIQAKSLAVTEEALMDTIKAFSDQIDAAEAALEKPAKPVRKPRKKVVK